VNKKNQMVQHLLLISVFLIQNAFASYILNPDQLETQAWGQLENQIEEENYQGAKQYYDSKRQFNPIFFSFLK
jgi:hypothetical protein